MLAALSDKDSWCLQAKPHKQSCPTVWWVNGLIVENDVHIQAIFVPIKHYAVYQLNSVTE